MSSCCRRRRCRRVRLVCLQAGMHHYSVGWWAPNADAKHSPQREDFKSYLCNETFLVG